ncbi:hypothetical protein BDW22DRAFT_440584 [Trametopsis cervina]|nr:hypothetical protein BDW22DRAFT_440584 [Trametopsis cervina]
MHPPPLPKALPYTPCFCEENVFLLARALLSNALLSNANAHANANVNANAAEEEEEEGWWGWDAYVVVVSNGGRMVRSSSLDGVCMVCFRVCVRVDAHASVHVFLRFLLRGYAASTLAFPRLCSGLGIGGRTCVSVFIRFFGATPTHLCVLVLAFPRLYVLDSGSVALWHQLAAQHALAPVIWDYHVFLVLLPSPTPSTNGEEEREAWVYDVDSRVGVPCTFDQYIRLTFPAGIPSRYTSSFRVIPASVYLAHLVSDRSHMLDANGRYLSQPPSYPPLSPPGSGSNLMSAFVDMRSASSSFSSSEEQGQEGTEGEDDEGKEGQGQEGQEERYGDVLDFEGFVRWGARRE